MLGAFQKVLQTLGCQAGQLTIAADNQVDGDFVKSKQSHSPHRELDDDHRHNRHRYYFEPQTLIHPRFLMQPGFPMSGHGFTFTQQDTASVLENCEGIDKK